jgi:hydrogenase nickel incorporation protein HypA/HybF
MHEWALAEGVIETARKVAEEKDIDEVGDVRVLIGQLQQIEADIFRFALDELLKKSDERVRGASCLIDIEPAMLECRPCSHRWPLGDELDKLGEDEAEAIHFVPELAHAYVRCPSCGSPDFRVTGGRGVSIASVEAR